MIKTCSPRTVRQEEYVNIIKTAINVLKSSGEQKNKTIERWMEQQKVQLFQFQNPFPMSLPETEQRA